MSDFDDEPAEGAEAIDDKQGAPKARKEPAPRSRQQPVDDDWDDDWDDDDVDRGPRRDMTLIYAIIAAVVVIVLAIVLTRPKSDNNSQTPDGKTATTVAKVLNWQGPVADAAGDVQTRIGRETGVFIWTDFEGWHVRSTLDSEVTVTVTATEIVQKGDKKGATPKTELTQTIASGNPKKGIDLDFGFSSSSTFEVSVAGTPIPANEIKLGGRGQAEENPVSFTKA